MTLRTRLFLYFLSISTLIIGVGLIFYFQLNNLIAPLTPQSIPQSIAKLEQFIGNQDLINQTLYQQFQLQHNLEDYVFTQKLSSLQEFYMNETILQQLEKQLIHNNPTLWTEIKIPFRSLIDLQNSILKAVLQGDIAKAKQELQNESYTSKSKEVFSLLGKNYSNTNFNLNEKHIATVKIAAKNTKNILQNSLNTTILIFVNAVLFSLLLTYFTSRKISRPINLLRSEIETMTKENYMHPPAMELVNLSGEVGDLARSFATLINKLQTTTVLKDELALEIERRKEFEEKLRQTAANLQETNRELDQFAYAASHDLRGPLHAIENLSEWIEEACYDILPPTSRRHFDLLKRRVRILNALISGMLEFARAGKAGVSPEIVDVNQLIAVILDNLTPTANVEIYIDNQLPTLKTNKVGLNQVFLNLITNAIKYNDKAIGEIHIGAKLFSNHVQFYVKDNGPGIPPEFHTKIFEIFQTLQPRDTVESAGIGLALVKKVIDKVKGSIWLSSTMGEGTTFFFNWPIQTN